MAKINQAILKSKIYLADKVICLILVALCAREKEAINEVLLYLFDIHFITRLYRL